MIQIGQISQNTQELQFINFMNKYKLYLYFFILVIMLDKIRALDFEAYARFYNKKYDKVQFQYRKEIYYKNSSKIQMNNKQNLPFLLQQNNFTDWDYQDLNNFLKVNIKNSTPAEKFNIRTAETFHSFDWRNFNKISPVKNQGRCGDCWAFVTTSLVQSIIAISNLTKYDLSEQYILQCVGNKSDCGGGDTFDALNFVLCHGIPKQIQFPYMASELAATNIKPHTENICKSQNNLKLSSNFKLKSYHLISDEYLQQLIREGPVVALFHVQQLFLHYKSGIYQCQRHYQEYEMNHALMIIGYDSSGNYIIKNSWGKDWGNEGFSIINKYKNCGLKQRIYRYTTSYGISLELILISVFFFAVIIQLN